MREKNVRVNEEELSSLKEYRDKHYPGIPMGFVIKELVEDARN